MLNHSLLTFHVLSERLTLFFVLTLQAEAFVWVNDALAHSQSVAKAKYEFLFCGTETEKPSETGKCFFHRLKDRQNLILSYIKATLQCTA